MIFFVASFLTSFLLFSNAVLAATWSSARFAATNPGTVPHAARTYLFDAGTIQTLITTGVPASPGNYSKYILGQNYGQAPLNITNVAPSSNFAAVFYTSPATGFIIRPFYQENTGNIRSVWATNNTFTIDPTVIATGLPLGSPIDAFQHNDAAGNLVILVQYTDANGLLTQRISNTDAGNWSDPVTVTT